MLLQTDDKSFKSTFCLPFSFQICFVLLMNSELSIMRPQLK